MRPITLSTPARGMAEDADFGPGVQCIGEIQGIESPRVCRRLQPLRDWGHETGKEVLPRGAGAGGSDGVRARERVLLAVGCPPVYCALSPNSWATQREAVRVCSRRNSAGDFIPSAECGATSL